MSTTHALYRFFDETGQLLYVGISADPGKRFSQHRGDKPWWEQVASITVQKVADRLAALDAEEAAIKHERPKYNVVHNQAVTRAPTYNPAELFRLVHRALYSAREQGGKHVEVLTDSTRRYGLNKAETLMVAWAEWSEHHLVDLTNTLEMLISQFPRERVDAIRQVARAELIANGYDVVDIDLLVSTAQALTIDLAREYLATLPKETAEEAIEATFDGEIAWAEAAAEARGWESFADAARRCAD